MARLYRSICSNAMKIEERRTRGHDVTLVKEQCRLDIDIGINSRRDGFFDHLHLGFSFGWQFFKSC